MGETCYICPMVITDDLISKLAKLSRLSVSEKEKEELRDELEKMIGFMDKLNELDTTGVSPLLHISAGKNVFRKDEVSGELDQEKVFLNAPAREKSFFKVPKVIKK